MAKDHWLMVLDWLYGCGELVVDDSLSNNRYIYICIYISEYKRNLVYRKSIPIDRV